MTPTDPDGTCDFIGCTDDAAPPEYDFCEHHGGGGWSESIDDVEPGDRVEFEYDNSEQSKIGTVESVRRGYRADLLVDVDGAKHSWRIGTGVTVTYEDKRRGEQTRHLGRLVRIRVIDE